MIWLFLIIGVHEITYTIDKNAISNRKKPKISIRAEQHKDGGTTVYYGLGYQIIDWHKLDSKKENAMNYIAFS